MYWATGTAIGVAEAEILLDLASSFAWFIKMVPIPDDVAASATWIVLTTQVVPILAFGTKSTFKSVPEIYG